MEIEATFLDNALLEVVNYVQCSYFGLVIGLLKKYSPDAFESIFKRLSDETSDVKQMSQIAEIKTLQTYDLVLMPTLLCMLKDVWKMPIYH